MGNIDPEIGVPGLFITFFGMIFLILAALCGLIATVARGPRRGALSGVGLLLVGLIALFVGSLVFVPEILARGELKALLLAEVAVGAFGLVGLVVGLGLGMIIRAGVGGMIPR